MDRDTKFCESFRDILGNEGVEPGATAGQESKPKRNLERFMLSVKSECLDRMVRSRPSDKGSVRVAYPWKLKLITNFRRVFLNSAMSSSLSSRCRVSMPLASCFALRRNSW